MVLGKSDTEKERAKKKNVKERSPSIMFKVDVKLSRLGIDDDSDIILKKSFK